MVDPQEYVGTLLPSNLNIIQRVKSTNNALVFVKKLKYPQVIDFIINFMFHISFDAPFSSLVPAYVLLSGH